MGKAKMSGGKAKGAKPVLLVACMWALPPHADPGGCVAAGRRSGVGAHHERRPLHESGWQGRGRVCGVHLAAEENSVQGAQGL